MVIHTPREFTTKKEDPEMSTLSSNTDTTALQQLLVRVLQRDALPTLTFTDPWGTAVAVGEKKIETRSWSAPRKYWYDPVAIHISGTLPLEAKMLCDESPFHEMLRGAGYSWDVRERFMWKLPLRQIIAITWLDTVERITAGFQVDQKERLFGNYMPGRYAWRFGAVYRLKQPVFAVGRLGIWQWTPPDSLWDEMQTSLDALRKGVQE